MNNGTELVIFDTGALIQIHTQEQFKGQRGTFGYAALAADGRIKYYESAEEAKKDGKDVPNAYTNRLLLHLGLF